MEYREKIPLQSMLHQQDQSLLKRYQKRVLTSERLVDLAYYEMAVLLASEIPGALGYVLRKWLYSKLFQYLGRGVILGRGVALRHPDRIHMGDRVAVDDHVLLDAQGAGPDGIRIGNEVIISRNCIVQGKTGPVFLEARTDIGPNTIISSAAGITIGRDTLISGNCYIGGARYNWQRTDIPMSRQGQHSKGPIRIGDDVWLGAGATVIDGVTIGKGSIIAAGAVVVSNLPEYVIAAGVPAKIINRRGKEPKKG
jgi:acetyltransferase-like isoleucine patch superfamily enzyme